MDLPEDVYMRQDGCARLGPSVTCDGFSPDAPIRIQSHVHHDHIKDLDYSKGYQRRIVSSQPTYDLLCSEFNADLPHRKSQWLVQPADGLFRCVDTVEIALFPSGHMVGSIMPAVRVKDSVYMYSSDFAWPLDVLPNTGVDVLIVDATYGDPANVRNYSHADVIDELLNFVLSERAKGPMLFSGYRGRLQYALHLLSELSVGPIIVSPRVKETLAVYMQHQGFTVEAHSLGTDAARRILESGENYVCFVELRDKPELLAMHALVRTRVLLSAFSVPRESPVASYGNGLTRIAANRSR